MARFQAMLRSVGFAGNAICARGYAGPTGNFMARVTFDEQAATFIRCGVLMNYVTLD